MERCIITSVSNKFFPSLLNLLGSLEKNYPGHPDVYVYDLGLFWSFRKELEKIPWVHIKKVPPFVSFWRVCYTWKTYIFDNPLALLNLYLDAGNQILKPLDDVFEKINIQGYLAVGVGEEFKNRETIPEEYIELFNLNEVELNREVMTAGIFGFKDGDEKIKTITQKLFNAAKSGLALGFSPNEQWKNKGVNKNPFIRKAKYFRHDNTLLCIMIAKWLPGVRVEPQSNFHSIYTGEKNQYIWNLRLNFQKLDYLWVNLGSDAGFLIKSLNKTYLLTFLTLKEINRRIKRNTYD